MVATGGACQPTSSSRGCLDAPALPARYDGIYLDEIAYDRITLQRTKKALGASRLIDHHSDQGGFTPSPAANYLELYPFIDSLWYGEGFDYETASPSYWLLEMSGVPHGLNADMLRYR